MALSTHEQMVADGCSPSARIYEPLILLEKGQVYPKGVGGALQHRPISDGGFSQARNTSSLQTTRLDPFLRRPSRSPAGAVP